jgi:hypothetical protein
MVSAAEIRQRLVSYLAGEIDHSVFEDWFVQNTWNARQSGDQELNELVQAIELRLSEYSSDHLDSAGLRSELLPFVTVYSKLVSAWASLGAFAGAAANVTARVEIPFAVAQQVGESALRESLSV